MNNIKQSLSGGIDPERIVNKEFLSSLGDFYKCCICFKIMIKPTDCEECGHSYCQECISKLKCPFGCETKSLKPSSIGIVNLLKNLKFNCPNEGCKAIVPYIEVKNHDLNCEYQKVLCTNKQCKKRIIKKDLEFHIKNICRYSLIKCKYCNTEYFRKEISQHEKLCSLTFQYLKNYNSINKDNYININDTFDITEKNFNKYIQSLSVNITKILKENNNFKNENINNNNDSSNKIKDKDEDIKKKKSLTYENDNNKINLENKKNKIIKNIDNKNIENKNIDNKNIDNKNIDNKNTTNKNNNIKNYNDESKQSLAQIEEDDLVDMIKKAIEEKLGERFVNYDINFNEFCHDLKDIKKLVCKLNTIEEVKESEEEDSELDIKNKSLSKERKFSNINNEDNNNSINLSNKNEESFNNYNENQNQSFENIGGKNRLKDKLKDVVNEAELGIKQSIILLNKNLLKLKNPINNNNSIENDKIENKKKIDKIMELVDEFANNIIICINKTKEKINNINNDLIKNNNKLNNLFKSKSNETNLDKNDNIITKIKTCLQNIVDKNKKDFLNKELESYNKFNNKTISEDKIKDKKQEKNENNIFSKNINTDYNIKNDDNFILVQSEVNKTMDTQIESMSIEIREVNNEIQLIKDIINQVKSLISIQFSDLSNQIMDKKCYNDRLAQQKNLIKEISTEFLKNKKTNFYSGIKSLKTIQPKKYKNRYKYNNFNSNKKIKKLEKKYRSTKTNLPIVQSKENIQLHERSYSSNSLYFYGSNCNLNEKQGFLIDNDILEKLLKIESKIKSVYEFFESIPDIVKEKINIDIHQNMFKLKEKVNKNLDEKIKSIFSLKFCENCEKIEYFYGFKKCSNCSNDCCKNCILLCSNCKQFLCKNCFQKGHQCDKTI